MKKMMYNLKGLFKEIEAKRNWDNRSNSSDLNIYLPQIFLIYSQLNHRYWLQNLSKKLISQTSKWHHRIFMSKDKDLRSFLLWTFTIHQIHIFWRQLSQVIPIQKILSILSYLRVNLLDLLDSFLPIKTVPPIVLKMINKNSKENHMKTQKRQIKKWISFRKNKKYNS